jgi:hypothetical protein
MQGDLTHSCSSTDAQPATLNGDIVKSEMADIDDLVDAALIAWIDKQVGTASDDGAPVLSQQLDGLCDTGWTIICCYFKHADVSFNVNVSAPAAHRKRVMSIFLKLCKERNVSFFSLHNFKKM